MKVITMAASNMAELLFKEKERLPRFEFYLNKAGEGEYQWGCEIGIIKLADTHLVIGEYCGGGAPFCYDFTDDTDESGLCECFEGYLRDLDCDRANDECIVYVDSGRYDGSPVPEVTVVIEGGMLTGVYSNLENLIVDLVDHDVSDEEAQRDVNDSMKEIRKRCNEGRLFSHW